MQTRSIEGLDQKLRAFRLTARAQSAEDTEKLIVFHYSKVKVRALWPYRKAEMTCKTKKNTACAPLRRSFAPLFLSVLAISAAVVAGAPKVYAQSTPAASASSSAPAAPLTAAPTPATPAVTQPASAVPAAPAAAPSIQSPGSPSADSQPGQPAIGRAQLPQDMSPWGMFLNADIIVKAVMIGLAFASLVTWTVFVAKTLELSSARRAVRNGLRILTNAVTLAQAHDQLRDSDSVPAQLMQAAAQEIRMSANARGDGLKERIAWQLERMEMAASRKISRGTGVLATIGSTAPFVGLFGTVWGIMNSFIGISNAHTTNLAVVAPGIAEALLATAFGLVAAIPAVMIYNVLARSTMHYRAMLGDASAQVMRLVSRDLDRAKLPLAQAAE
jgi:biopolymer transport protein ExbB